ncbi:MAG: 2-hydroxycarboxylate transporter family protein [Cellulosilyticaceae bacterium]
MNVSTKQRIEIMGIDLITYSVIAVVMIVAIALDVLPKGMAGALLVMMVMGSLFNKIGNNLPIVKTYLGGGAIVAIFASAALVSFNIIPPSIVENVDKFMNEVGFLNFYIAALITGSILGMNRSLLLKAAIRFLPVALCAMTMGVLVAGTVGALVGYGFKETIMYIAIPMMGGGMGAGVVPLSDMYSQATGLEAAQMISKMIPASTLGNVVAIISAGMIGRLALAKPSWNGNGKLMKKAECGMQETVKAAPDYTKMGIGLMVSLSFFAWGSIVGKFIPAVHPYAWMIITVVILKAVGVIPDKLEHAAQQWSQFVMTNFTSALLVGIGIAMIDLNAVAAAFTPLYFFLVIVVVVSVAIGAGIGGKLVGFYPVEAAITAGLCTTNMGGTGDIAVLSASNRMELIPFAQISTRICGAITLIVASILLKLFV